LRQAWPPASQKGDEGLTDFPVTLAEVEEYDNRIDDYGKDSDIGTIKSMLKGKKNDFDLVMRQTVANAQGADVMILSRKVGKVTLHLFQCKNMKTIPGVNTGKFVESFRSLGVNVSKGGKDIDVEPQYGSAGFSYLGTQHFARKLGEKLGTPVTIGHRILVFSKEWKGELPRDFLQKAQEKGVMVWSREMLEPTVSALYTKPVDAANTGRSQPKRRSAKFLQRKRKNLEQVTRDEN
jgi:hypothetical protein